MFSIYTIADGAVWDDLIAETLDDAYALYEDLIRAELARKAQAAPGTHEETTVHLYDAHEASMSMLAEYCITRN